MKGRSLPEILAGRAVASTAGQGSIAGRRSAAATPDGVARAGEPGIAHWEPSPCHALGRTRPDELAVIARPIRPAIPPRPLPGGGLKRSGLFPRRGALPPAGRARGDNFRVFSQPDLGLFSDGLETGDLSRGGHTRP